MQKKHYCPKCGNLLEKVKGTKATYECEKCGFRHNFKMRMTFKMFKVDKTQ